MTGADWRNVPVTAGMLASVLESCMSNDFLADFNVGGFLDLIAGAMENAARKSVGQEPLP